MKTDCNVIDILMKPNIKGIPIVIILCLLTVSIYVGGNTYKNSEEYLEKYITYRWFVIWYTIAVFVLYILLNFLLENKTMVGYYLKLNKKPIKKNC